MKNRRTLTRLMAQHRSFLRRQEENYAIARVAWNIITFILAAVAFGMAMAAFVIW